MPGLDEQPVWGLQGLKEGAHLWGEGAGQDRDLSPADTHPLLPPLCQHTAQPSPASQATDPTLPPPSTMQVPAVGSRALGTMAEGWDHLDAGVLPAGSPFTWARRFICKEKTPRPESWGQAPRTTGTSLSPQL